MDNDGMAKAACVVGSPAGEGSGSSLHAPAFGSLTRDLRHLRSALASLIAYGDAMRGFTRWRSWIS